MFWDAALSLRDVLCLYISVRWAITLPHESWGAATRTCRSRGAGEMKRV